MSGTRFLTLTGAMLVACSFSSNAWAVLAVPGNYQIANGGANDWSPSDAPLMTDQTGGIFTLDLTGMANAPTVTRFEVKILDAGNDPPNWGQPEVGGGAANTWFLADASLTVDRNTYNDGFLPATDRMTSSDIALMTDFFATGSWMDESGGAADWDPADPLFQMTDQGGGIWSVDATISVVGSYEFKVLGAVPAGAINQDDGQPLANNFALQFGTNGRIVNAANWAFDTIVPNQDVTFLLDTSGAISLATIPEPTTCVLALAGLLAMTAGRRRR